MHEEQILIDHARNYMQAVNAVHRKYIPLYREGKRDLFGSYRQELELVREHYLVPKKRDWQGGLFNPPPYSEAEAPNTVFQAELVSEKRGIVTVLTNGKLDFRFTLQRRKDGWKISSIAERFHSPDRTVEYQWRWTDL